MNPMAAGDHLPIPCVFEPAKRRDDKAALQFPLLVQAPGESHLNRLGCAIWANSGVMSRPNELSERSEPP